MEGKPDQFDDDDDDDLHGEDSKSSCKAMKSGATSKNQKKRRSSSVGERGASSKNEKKRGSSSLGEERKVEEEAPGPPAPTDGKAPPKAKAAPPAPDVLEFPVEFEGLAAAGGELTWSWLELGGWSWRPKLRFF